MELYHQQVPERTAAQIAALIMSAGLWAVTLDARVYFSANWRNFGSAAALASGNPQVPSQPPPSHSHFIAKELRSCDAFRDRPGPDSGVLRRENAKKKSPKLQEVIPTV